MMKNDHLKEFCVRHAGICVRLQVVKNFDVIYTFSRGVRKSLANVRTSLAFLRLAVRIVLKSDKRLIENNSDEFKITVLFYKIISGIKIIT